MSTGNRYSPRACSAEPRNPIRRGAWTAGMVVLALALAASLWSSRAERSAMGAAFERLAANLRALERRSTLAECEVRSLRGAVQALRHELLGAWKTAAKRSSSATPVDPRSDPSESP